MTQLCTLGAATRDPATNSLLVQCKGAPLSEDPDDAEDFGQLPMCCALGVAAMPYPATELGAAEGVVESVPGVDGLVIGARDTRTAAITGNMKPGDTVVHSTGPEQAAQLQLKEAKKQAVLCTKGSDGRQVLVLLDGANDKLQIIAFGALIEMTSENGVVLTSETGGASIQLKGDTAIITATNVILGGRTPVAPVLAGAPPGAPAPGVFVGS